MQAVRAEVALDNQVPVRGGLKAWDPALEEAVQFVLAHPDRRIRPDRAEHDVLGHLVGENRSNVLESERGRVATDEIECPLVHVDGPDRGMG